MKMSFVKTVWVTVLFSIPFLVRSQSPVGLWEALNVTVGEEIMTPVGKWTRINQEGTYQSGDGWQQNSEGTWFFDPGTGIYKSAETNGLEDVYGGFKVAFENGNMIWRRNEDGLPVVVTWISIKTIPKTPADLIVGVWERISDGTRTPATSLAATKDFLFIRWDRICVAWDRALEKSYGYWFINAHRPELTFISMSGTTAPDVWKINVSDQTLTLTGMSEGNKTSLLSFRRIHRIPE